MPDQTKAKISAILNEEATTIGSILAPIIVKLAFTLCVYTTWKAGVFITDKARQVVTGVDPSVARKQRRLEQLEFSINAEAHRIYKVMKDNPRLREDPKVQALFALLNDATKTFTEGEAKKFLRRLKAVAETYNVDLVLAKEDQLNREAYDRHKKRIAGKK